MVEKIDYEKIQPEDLSGEEVHFTFEREESAPVFCTDCAIEMKPVKINIQRDDMMILKVDAYKCPKCHREVLDIYKASEISKKFALMHAEKQEGYELTLLKDEVSSLIRFPKEVSKKLSKKHNAKLFPISDEEYLLKIIA